MDKESQGKMKYLYFLTLLCVVSCSFRYDYKIEELQHKSLSYSELPECVRTVLSVASLCNTSAKDLLFVNPTDSLYFRFEIIKTITGPWIDYCKLTDIDKGIAYRIRYNSPLPCIIYKKQKKMYIPERYNIFSGSNYETCMYTEYEMK